MLRTSNQKTLGIKSRVKELVKPIVSLLKHNKCNDLHRNFTPSALNLMNSMFYVLFFSFETPQATELEFEIAGSDVFKVLYVPKLGGWQ